MGGSFDLCVEASVNARLKSRNEIALTRWMLVV